MITRSDLKKMKYHYAKIALGGEKNKYENVNFTHLLVFIGKNYPSGDKNYIACAYKIIQERTDKLLKVDWKNHNGLHTSKREISSIRWSRYWFLALDHYYIRIPYKITFIFTAIINIIKEIRRNGTAIPPCLNDCINRTYGLSFYNYHMDLYADHYQNDYRMHENEEGPMGYPAKLHEEFTAPANIFGTHFV